MTAQAAHKNGFLNVQPHRGQRSKIGAFMVLCAACAALFCLPCSWAAECTVEADKTTVALGDAAYVGIMFSGATDIPAPQLPAIDGFQTQYTGPSTNVTVINGAMTSAITHNFIFIPLKSGSYTIGPFSFVLKGKTYSSNSITMRVVDAPSGSSGGASAVQGSAGEPKDDISEALFMIIEPSKRTVYTHEQFDIVLKLYVGNIRVQLDGSPPQITHEGFVVTDFDKPRQYTDTVNNREYTVVEYRAKASAAKDGVLVLGPAAVRCMVTLRGNRRTPFGNNFGSLFGDDFFGGVFEQFNTHPVDVSAEPAKITVVSVPEAGKPADFSGALGTYSLNVEYTPQSVSAGDPVTVGVSITGEGNLEVVPAPKLNLPEDDFKVYEPKVTIAENSKTFEYAVIPKHERVTEIPKISFSYFDTSTNAYNVLQSGPFPLSVRKAAAQPVPVAMPVAADQHAGASGIDEPVERQIVYIKEAPGRLAPRDQYFSGLRCLVIQIVLVFIFLGVRFFHAYRMRLASDVGLANQLCAPKVARGGLKAARVLLASHKAAEFYETLFKTLQRYLGYKMRMPWQSITVDIVEHLRRRGVEQDIIRGVEHVCAQCDMARFSSSGFNETTMRDDFEILQTVINALERKGI